MAANNNLMCVAPLEQFIEKFSFNIIIIFRS
ncbi:uncharacterized protein METZ01_LOCUS82555 [marine metagenome]|uniref:Uncharacterized protein n=1 Tax=marine metagenome TaxID=408172 RepID=A0A381UPK7_9ZZZZ